MSEACIDISVQYIYTLCSIPPTPKGVGFLLQFIVIKKSIRAIQAFG